LALWSVLNYATFYLLLPALPISILMNTIIVIIFVGSPLRTSKTTRFYYVVIAICEILTVLSKEFLYFFVGNGIFVVGEPSIVRIWEQYDWCYSVYCLWFMNETIANNAIVALAAERVIALYYPFKARNASLKRASLGMAFVFLVVLCIALIGGFVHVMRIMHVQPNPYMLHAVGCYAGGEVASLFSAVLAVNVLFIDFALPATFSMILTSLIVHQMRQTTMKKLILTLSDKSGMNRSEIESCMTLVILATMNVVLYVPLFILRCSFLVFPRIVHMTEDQQYLLNGIGFNIYVFLMPLHGTNFVVYCRRVHGFAENVARLFRCQPFVNYSSKEITRLKFSSCR
jgi:hypothetical protein